MTMVIKFDNRCRIEDLRVKNLKDIRYRLSPYFAFRNYVKYPKLIITIK